MIISLNWLKKFVDIDVSVDKIVDLINTRLVEVESVIDLGKKYDKALIVRVVEAKPLEGSDHLNVVKIDDNKVVAGLDRDKKGFVQVVCGAPNIAKGQMVVWLPPKSIVPQTFGSSEQFVLDTRKLRGVVSNGMVASAKELDLYDEHKGILVLDTDAKPGSSFAKTFELDDFLLNIENKSLTHRPDCFGIIGFAREVAAILGKDFVSPDWILNLKPFFGTSKNKIKVAIDDPRLSDRYQAIVMSGADSNKQSPTIIQTYLARVGLRPISAIVDVTNYIMMLTGQPLHAFDFDKMAVAAGNTYDYEIHVRAGRKNEKLELLDGRIVTLSTEDIVIAAGETAVGLAGAMGGANTVIDGSTRAIIIESASFNLYKLRATQMRHGIFSEAITRFTKGQPAKLTAPALGEAVRLIKQWTNFQTETSVADAYVNKKEKQLVKVPLQKVNDVLGTDFSVLDAANSIGHGEFRVSIKTPLTMIVEVPYWRADINITEDVVEEIGRINGFDNIKSTLPMRDFTAICPSDFDIFLSNLRKILVRSGANEVLTYSFIHGDIIRKVCQKPENSYRLVNSISPDLQYFRQTLMASLLNLVHPNIKQGNDEFALFEINKCHYKPDGLTDEKVPIESDNIALVVASKTEKNGAAYYQAKKIIEFVANSFGIKLKYKKIIDKENPASSPLEECRSAELFDKESGLSIGFVGEYKTTVAKIFKLPQYAAGFEINTRKLYEIAKSVGKSYKPVSRFPATDRDICFKVGQSVTCDQIIEKIDEILSKTNLETIVEVIDIYKKPELDTKNITVRIKLTPADHTLKGDEVNLIINNVVSSVVNTTGAQVV